MCLTCARHSVLSTFFSLSLSTVENRLSPPGILPFGWVFPPKSAIADEKKALKLRTLLQLSTQTSFKPYPSTLRTSNSSQKKGQGGGKGGKKHCRKKQTKKIPLKIPEQLSGLFEVVRQFFCWRWFALPAHQPRGERGGRRVQADRWAGNRKRYPQTLPSRKSFIFQSPQQKRQRCKMPRAEIGACSWHPHCWNDAVTSPTLLNGRWTSKKENWKKNGGRKMRMFSSLKQGGFKSPEAGDLHYLLTSLWRGVVERLDKVK